MKKNLLVGTLLSIVVLIYCINVNAATASDVISYARGKLGSTSYNGLCTKFVGECYGAYGIVGHATSALDACSKWRKSTSSNNIPVGAVVFFNSPSYPQYGHIGIYVGNGNMIHAVSTVREEAISQYWWNNYLGWGWFGGVELSSVSPPSAPTNCLAGSWDDRVQIQWDRVDNADYYECGLIEVNTRELVVKADINDWYYNFYGVPEGQYFAYVCAHNSAGTSSHSNWYRVDVNYTVPAAASVTLNTDKTIEGNSVKVSWNAVPNAKYYEYYLTEFPVGYAYGTYTKHENIQNTNVTFTDLKSGHYEFFVHAITPQGKWGPQSNWVKFDVYAKDYIPTKIISHDNRIYALYDYEMSWSFARDLCTDLGGHLVTVTNQKENDVITDLIGYGNMDAYWLGASDYGRDEKDYAWVTDEEFSYSHWADGEPSSNGVDGTKEHFAEIRKSYGNKWNDTHNINKASKGFILEIETHDIKPAATETFNGNTYMIFDKNTTWSEAEHHCEMLGGHLVSINNSQENEFLKEFLQNGERNWYYIGADRTSGSWKWIDGNKFNDITWADDADNWKGNYLMIYKFSKKCVGFNNAYFPENDICHIGFVCEIESEPIHPIILDLNSYAVTENMNLKNIVNANICNNSVSAINAEIIFAYSRSDGTLIKLNRQNISIPPKDAINIEDNTNCKITELEKNLVDKVEVYVWDSLNGMKPLSEKVVSEFVYE